MLPSERDYSDVAVRLMERDKRIVEDLIRRAEKMPEPKPEPITETKPAMPLTAFPVVGLPVSGRTLPDSGPLGERIRVQSTNAAKHVILKLLGERKRLCRHGKG